MASSLDVTDFARTLDTWAEEVHDDALRGMQERLTDVAPVDTGFLRDESVTVFAHALSGTIVYEADYASFTDEGTDPHRIEGNPLLAFEIDGELVIVHSVEHPGTTGTRWWSDTMTDDVWAEALEEAAARVAF
jgi:hypothetical protein